MRLGHGIALTVAAVLLAACGGARKVEAVSAAGGVCASCHGGQDNASGAPPFDVQGRSDTTLVSVGGHSAHVAAGLDCGHCHPKPAAVVAPGHADGRVDLRWGALATANGAVDPTFDATTATCSNVYCHGAFDGGNRANAPRWTRVGAGEGACGTCHAIPPARSTGHPQSGNCGGCHAGYTRTSVNPALHLNGAVDYGTMTCTSCHGTPDRAATPLNPQLAAAPPFDVSGDDTTTAPGVGAHQAHLTDGALRGAMACTECHVVPSRLDGHPTGTIVFGWDPLLAATRAAAPEYSAGRCNSTYCHGATLSAGGTNHAPRWTGGPAEAACGTCHGLPPPSPHVQNADCGRCHPGYTATSVNLATHVNGRRDLGALTCTTCHGDASRAPTSANPALPIAPPFDTSGLTSSQRVGAHLVHLQGSALSSPVACAQCHVLPSSGDHATGMAELTWGQLATGEITQLVSTNTALSAFSTTTPGYSGGSCSSTYCHGTYSGVYTYAEHQSDPVVFTSVAYVSVGASPSWSGAAPCGSCHGIPPQNGGWHSASHGAPTIAGGNDCNLCHPDAQGTAGNAILLDPTKHVDGKIDLAPKFKSACFGCH